jgi:hypothetical protein
MSPESTVNLSPILTIVRSDSATGCRCGLCEARRTARLAHALHNRYSRGLTLLGDESMPQALRRP